MVLDGNSIINRAYYGVRPLTTRDGFFTHAIFGFLTMLGRLLDEEKPEALCVAFDRRELNIPYLRKKGFKPSNGNITIITCRLLFFVRPQDCFYIFTVYTLSFIFAI